MAAEYPSAIFTAMTRGPLMSDATTQGAFVDKLQEELRAVMQTLGVSPQGVLATVAAAVAPTAWTAVTFQNSWVNFGGGYQAMQYRKVGDMVQLRGTIAAGTVTAVGFTLPVGFRPPANVQMPVRAGPTTGDSYLDIATTGSVTIFAVAGQTVTILGEFSITA